MYKILIVDDEKNEREGISKLISKYHFDLEVRFATNGEEALEVFEKEHIDILLTDIKMPLMTGIELIEQVDKRGWNPIYIIYSAYGEFEYAQHAIRLGVLQYLLKPIKLEEFEKLFQRVLSICDEKNRKQYEIQQTLKKVQNEKEARKVLLYLEFGEQGQINEEENIIVTPILFSSYSTMIIKCWEDYEKELQGIFGNQLIVINRGDSQFLLLLKEEISEKELKKKCQEMIQVSLRNYQSKIFVVAGNTVFTWKKLKEEYLQIEEQLDFQFFTSESTFLYNKNGVIRKTSDMLQMYFEKILTYARLKDYQGMKEEFFKAFEYVEKEEGFSSIYIKYNFSEILKKCCGLLHRDDLLLKIVEKIYIVNSIEDMKDLIFNMIETMSQSGEESTDRNRLVLVAKHIVQERYGDCTLSVASIADSLNVTAAYLSTLFKIETKQNLIKYISQYRMEKAKEMLTVTNLKVSDIAEKVGYVNTSYFISLFKNYVGYSPAKYREKIF